VQLLTSQLDVAGACAYASNYPPVGEYIDASQVKFTGTSMYKIVVEKTGSSGTHTEYSDSLYRLNPGCTILSFTDKTGAPGIMKCMLPATYTLNVSAPSFCEGSEGVQFALSGTEDERRYQLYRDGTAVDGAALEGDGSAATFTGSFNVAGTYTARTVADDKYCAIAMNGMHVITENPLPDNPTVNNNSRNCPGTVTLSASSPGAVIDWYADAAATLTLYTGASYTTPEIEESTTYYAQARFEHTSCLSERVPVLAEVITEGCCHAPGVTGVTFAAFNPCTGADYGSTYTLTDDRDQKTYKVKYLPDNRYWMVQDLAFGEKCETKSSMGGATTTGNITVSGTYYGDCYKVNFAGAGYGYNMTAAMNYGITQSGYTCSGTYSGYENGYPATCRGICPENWHLPTSAEYLAINDYMSTINNCISIRCWSTVLEITMNDLLGNTQTGCCSEAWIANSTGKATVYGISNDAMTVNNTPEAQLYIRCTMNLP
jgi:uncharacterized protein (TIGR02145 family)